MMEKKLRKDRDIPLNLKHCVDFHGHLCPGLSYGYVISKEIIDKFKLSKANDEEIVIIAECDSCTVDAFQVLLGTTIGKGNLVINNYGKNVYTVFLRNLKKAYKFVKKTEYEYNGPDNDDFLLLNHKIINGTADKNEQSKYKKLKSLDIISRNFNELFSIKEVFYEEPEYAEIAPSVRCDECGEFTMSSKTAFLKDGRHLCLKCIEKTLNN